jgi:hypothetical protein
MTETAPEQRTAVMILVEVTWEDQSGTAQKTRACRVNRSMGGACIRVRQPIHVGAKLRVQWRWEQFTGTTRYCRTLLARKADENQQIMAELEGIKATYAERMRRNLEGVAREQATFGNWPATKQQELQSISEALELCGKAEANEPAGHTGNNGLVSTPLKTV